MWPHPTELDVFSNITIKRVTRWPREPSPWWGHSPGNEATFITPWSGQSSGNEATFIAPVPELGNLSNKLQAIFVLFEYTVRTFYRLRNP